MTRPDNPHAFPQPDASGRISEEGMSLRDYFAARAMQGMVVGTEYVGLGPERIAVDAYELADAMLKERDNGVG